MNFLLHATAMFVPGFLRLGRLHLPVYGLFAAAGLVAALALSQRTARSVGIPAEKLWDAGLFGIVASFIASRALLVAMDPHAFLKYPLLVLALPSLTYGGMVLTGVLVLGYLRWKRLPLGDVLDAWAPCAALLAAVLSLGHFVEGTEAGMPTRLPWGVVTPGDTVLGHVHPVQLYAMAVALVLCVVLLRVLSRRRYAGKVAGIGLLVGGAIAFLLDMLTQPVESLGDGWLDPGQWIALAAIIVGASILLYRPSPPLTREEVALILENFVSGQGGAFDHEALEYEKTEDSLLIEIRERFINLQSEFPRNPGQSGYCNEQGLEVLLNYARQLRNDGEQSKKELV